MQTQIAPKVSKWPFAAASAVLFFIGWFIFHNSHLPLAAAGALAIAACAGLGAVIAVWPFVMEYRAISKLAEAAGLADVVSQVQNVELIAGEIKAATAQWQTVQDAADKTARSAKEISDTMANEVKGFQMFLERANDSERSGLRLEVEKFRRAEAEWLQVLVRMLDHTFALHRAALQSRQQPLIDQLGQFQNACRDAARRVGLTPFAAAQDEEFNDQKHQLLDGEPRPAEGGVVHETVATGYTYQGRLLRPALVRLRNGNGDAAHTEPENAEAGLAEEKPDAEQNQLPLGTA